MHPAFAVQWNVSFVEIENCISRPEWFVRSFVRSLKLNRLLQICEYVRSHRRVQIACSVFFWLVRRSLYTRGWNGRSIIKHYCILFIWCNKFKLINMKWSLANRERSKIFKNEDCFRFVFTLETLACEWKMHWKCTVNAFGGLWMFLVQGQLFKWVFFSLASSLYQHQNNDLFELPNHTALRIAHQHFKIRIIVYCLLGKRRYHLLPIRIVRKLFDYC